MIPVLILVAALLGGTALTYLFDDDSPLTARLAFGGPIGLTLLGLVGYVLAASIGFTGTSVALATALVLLPVALVGSRRERTRVGDDVQGAAVGLRQLARPQGRETVVLLFLALLATLILFRLYERALFVAPSGALHTGVDHNLGDLPYHLGIINSFLLGQNFPPEHPELLGARLTYPFLVDFVTAQLMRAGASVEAAFLAQNLCLAICLLLGLHRFSRLATGDRAAAVVACVLVMASGGLGFWWLKADVDPSQGVLAHLGRLTHDYTILHTGELRWGNLFICMLIPQRSLLLGMPLFLGLAAQWWRAAAEGDDSRRRCLGAGAMAGLLPLVHGHTLALALAVGFVVFAMFRRFRGGTLYLAAALVVAAPQLVWMAVSSSMDAGAFVGRHLGWDRGAQGVLSFWWWNLGLFLPMSVVAVLWRGATPVVPRTLLLFYAPFALCFVVPNLVRLSPWIWDNIKFLVYWHVGAAPLVALLLVRLWRLRWRFVAVVLFLVLTLAGTLDLWRVASRTISHEVFDAPGTVFAQRIAALTPPRAVILHATTFNSEVYLSGRRSVLGYPGHIWSQGLDAGTREEDIRRIYRGDPEQGALLARYAIDYVLVGPREREAGVNEDAFFGWRVVAEAGERTLYAVPGRRLAPAAE